jgi:hypothetical protein
VLWFYEGREDPPRASEDQAKFVHYETCDLLRAFIHGSAEHWYGPYTGLLGSIVPQVSASYTQGMLRPHRTSFRTFDSEGQSGFAVAASATRMIVSFRAVSTVYVYRKHRIIRRRLDRWYSKVQSICSR